MYVQNYEKRLLRQKKRSEEKVNPLLKEFKEIKKQLLKKVKNESKLRGYSQNTIKTYVSIISNFLEYSKNFKIQQKGIKQNISKKY